MKPNRNRPRSPRLARAAAHVAQPSLGGEGALAIAIERREWERVALLLLVAVARVAEAAPPGTIDELLSLLDAEVMNEDMHDA